MLAAALAVSLAAGAAACGSSEPPTVAPSPSPSPTPPAEVPRGCGLPPSTAGYECRIEIPEFAYRVNEAIALVQHERPEYFDFGLSQGGMSYFVRDGARYHSEVVRHLEEMGFCAFFDGKEVGVKNTNESNEQYQVLTSLGYVRWGAGAYRGTCRPAWF